ncbi:hypothetical protein HDU76_002102 [Blyttiomyces sp. JEL0837]|nr:hypothetical protein HDU76_002102 [Blyttiomyces sp. JEL0837]
MLAPKFLLIAATVLATMVTAKPLPGGGGTTTTTTTTSSSSSIASSTSTSTASSVSSTSTASSTTKSTTSTSSSISSSTRTTSTTTASSSTTAATVPTPTFVGKMSLTNVAFVKIVANADTTSDLYLSTFTGNPFSSDAGYFIPAIGSKLATFNATTATKIGGSITWPNEMSLAPASVFGKDGVLAAGGFLVTGHTNGGISYSTKTDATTPGAWKTLWSNSNGYFYHRAIVMDVDGDGLPDILSARATKPLLGSGSGSMVYLTPNNRSNPTGAWTEHVVGPHMDTFFTVADLNGDGIPEIISAEYWGSALTVISVKDPKAGLFSNATNLIYNVLDTTGIGHAFDVEIVDLNGDGKKEILVTNHQGSSDTPTGSVYAYEIPADITAPAASWTKHTLATNFPVLQSGTNQAAPGAAHTFHPKVGATDKPSIVVAGDGAQKAYLLTPNSQATSDWTYTLSVLHDCVNTVGGINVGDVNGDGFVEIFIPCYDDGHLVSYSYGKF